MERLSLWWTKKYKLPYNHELFQDRTIFDLLTEFYVDYYENAPLEAYRNPDGHIQFKDTGDSLIDKWEEQIARGQSPDLNEAFTAEQRESLQRLRARGKARTRLGGSFKEVVESMEREARRQGLHNVSTRGPSTIRRPVGRRVSRSNFGDGYS